MTSRLVVGRILKPQGVKGEVKIEPYTKDIRRFLGVKYLFDENANQNYNVTSARVDGAFVYIKLENISTMNDAELLRNHQVSLERNDATPLEEGHYYLVDIIGCSVITNADEQVGKVTDILQYGAADVYVLDTAKGEVMFPAGDGVIVDVDIDNKKIVVDAKRYREVTEYDED